MLNGVNLRVQLAHTDKRIGRVAAKEGGSVLRSLFTQQDFVAVAVRLGHVLTTKAARLHVF